MVVLILEAHIQGVGGRRFDGHRQALAADVLLRRHLVAQLAHRFEHHAVLHHQLAEAAAAAEAVVGALVDDALVEGTETVNVKLTNPSAGLALGTPPLRGIEMSDYLTRDGGTFRYASATSPVWNATTAFDRVTPSFEAKAPIGKSAVPELKPGELIVSVSFPSVAKAAYVKYKQPASRFALVGVFVAQLDGGVRVAVTGGGNGVMRHAGLEQAPYRVPREEEAPRLRHSLRFGLR